MARVGDTEERPVGCRMAKATVTPAMSQVPVIVTAPSSGPQMVETHTHLMKRRLAILGRDIRDVISNRPFSVLIATWLKLSVTLPNNMLVAQWNLSFESDYHVADPIPRRQWQYDSAL